MINVKGWLVPVFCLCISGILPDAPTQAETYVAGQFGLLDHGTLKDPKNLSSDLGLKNSLMYGAKLGHYMENLKYFGIETEAYTSTPHVRQERTVAGGHLRVTTWAANAVYRYPGKVFQPYAGIGGGVFFAGYESGQTGRSDSSISPGLNVQVGLRVLLNKEIALFTEYKFNHTRMNFADSNTRATYQANLFVFGVGYHF